MNRKYFCFSWHKFIKTLRFDLQNFSDALDIALETKKISQTSIFKEKIGQRIGVYKFQLPNDIKQLETDEQWEKQTEYEMLVREPDNRQFKNADGGGIIKSSQLTLITVNWQNVAIGLELKTARPSTRIGTKIYKLSQMKIKIVGFEQFTGDVILEAKGLVKTIYFKVKPWDLFGPFEKI